MKRIAIITGASGGLGSAVTEALLSDGWIVVAGARQPSKADALQELRKNYGEQLIILEADVTNEDHLKCLAETAIQKGNLQLVINNAGTANGKALETLSMTEVEEVFHVNVHSALRLIQLTLPELQRSGGTIINISSVVGSVALPYLGIYSASKHALNALTLALHLEMLDSQVRFVLVQPGPLSSRLCGDAIADPERGAYQNTQQSMRDGVRRVGRKHGVPTEKAASIILQSLQRKKQFQIVVIGTWTKIILLLAKVLPSGIFQKLLAWHYRVQLRRKTT